MKVEVIRGEVKPVVLPIKEVILTLNEEDARTLYAIANYPHAVSEAAYLGEHKVRIKGFLNRLFNVLRRNYIYSVES